MLEARPARALCCAGGFKSITARLAGPGIDVDRAAGASHASRSRSRARVSAPSCRPAIADALAVDQLAPRASSATCMGSSPPRAPGCTPPTPSGASGAGRPEARGPRRSSERRRGRIDHRANDPRRPHCACAPRGDGDRHARGRGAVAASGGIVRACRPRQTGRALTGARRVRRGLRLGRPRGLAAGRRLALACLYAALAARTERAARRPRCAARAGRRSTACRCRRGRGLIQLGVRPGLRAHRGETPGLRPRPGAPCRTERRAAPGLHGRINRLERAPDEHARGHALPFATAGEAELRRRCNRRLPGARVARRRASSS